MSAPGQYPGSRKSFFAALFAAALIELRALPGGRRGFFRPEDTAGIETFLARHANLNLYFGVASRKDASSGDLTNCGQLWALFVDIDFKNTTEAEARSRLDAFPIRPSIIIRTGGGLHAYWILQAPLDVQLEQSRIYEALRGLARAVGGDLTAAEPARILRVPGTLNRKYTPARWVVIETFDTDQRVTLGQVLAHVPAEPDGNAHRAPFAAPAMIRDGERNATLYRLARSFKAKGGLARDEILAALRSVNAHRCRPPVSELEVEMIAAGAWSQRDRPNFAGSGQPASRGSLPWTEAQPACDFINAPDVELHPLFAPLLFPGAVTELFSPRGIGKTQSAYGIAVTLARTGKRVLLLDRDNPPREIRRRLRAWGASDLTALKLLTRDKVPPLTDSEAWKTFPVADYDFVIIDSLDATTEGVGEKDSAKPSRALAPILDLARRPDGPAVLVLGNTIKSAAHARGSGVVEDRADIVFEVRDATDLEPTGRKPWWQELPPAGAEAWAERAARRKRRDKYRLALVPTKFRVGEEPEPLVLELDLSGERWQLLNVTAQVVQAAEASDTDRSAREISAALHLQAEIRSRDVLRGQAVEFLEGRGLGRNQADRLINKYQGQLWRLAPVSGQRGHGQRLEALESPGGGGNQAESPTPRPAWACEASISPGRTQPGRGKPTIQDPTPDAGIAERPDFPRPSLIPSAPRSDSSAEEIDPATLMPRPSAERPTLIRRPGVRR